MDVLLWICVLWSFEDGILSAEEQAGYFNLTTESNNESATVIPTLFNSVTPEGTSNTSLPVSPETSFNITASTTDNSSRTEPTETVTEIFTSTEVNLSFETTTIAAQPTTTISRSQPLPLSGSLPPPVTDVSSLCPCNLQEGQCDVNCCCDQECVGDFKLFTECSVEKLVANAQMCTQDTASYSLSTAVDGSARVQSSVTQEVNPDVFCIQTANYGAGLSFAPPEVPTEGNFDALFRRFAGGFFDTTGDGGLPNEQDSQNVPAYKYGDVIQTQEDTGERGFLRLPTSTGSAHCTDANPAAFLQDQTSQCVRSFRLEQDCGMPSLSLQTYTGFRILSAKTENRTLVDVDLTTMAVQSLGGLRARVDPADAWLFEPALLEVGNGLVCNNVVLQVAYRVTYSEGGEIVAVGTSVVLAAVNQTTLPVLQEFSVAFVQQDTDPRELPYSGNPGYVVGLPLVAGRRTAEGVFRSADRNGGLTLLRSPGAEQDCLGATGLRTPVQFGVNAASGCTLRLAEAANCSLVSELILGVLRGPDPPNFVASFGNSPPNVILDWVPIKNRTTSTTSPDALGCSIPLSLDLEVKWTKYGSLVNPQAQIVSVMEVIQTNSSSLSSLSGGSESLLVSTSVTFVDVSAAAQPGYRAAPTIDAKLPYDFFFPFV